MGSAISLKTRQETVREMLVRCLSSPVAVGRPEALTAAVSEVGQRVCGGSPVDLVVAYAYAEPRLDVLRASDGEFRAWLEALRCNANSVRVETRDGTHAYPVLAFHGLQWRTRPHPLCAHVTVSQLVIDRRRHPDAARCLLAIHGATLSIRPRRPTESLGQMDGMCESWSLLGTGAVSVGALERSILAASDDDKLDNCIGVAATGGNGGNGGAVALLFAVRHYDTRLVTRVAHDRYDPITKQYAECDDANRDASDRAAVLVLCHASRIVLNGGGVTV